ncbi:unnamed protein product [Boreogadus saida]
MGFHKSNVLVCPCLETRVFQPVVRVPQVKKRGDAKYLQCHFSQRKPQQAYPQSPGQDVALAKHGRSPLHGSQYRAPGHMMYTLQEKVSLWAV